MIKVIGSKVHQDGRGSFIETWRAEDFDMKFVQANLSYSRPYVLRGLHYRVRGQQAKLMRCVTGSAAVVAVDLRRADRGKWEIVHLNEQNAQSVLIPPGHAAGFLALGRGATMSYLMTAYHDPADDHALDALDPALGIEWPRYDYVRSARDRIAPRLEAISLEDLPK